jgi:hypothetical protein
MNRRRFIRQSFALAHVSEAAAARGFETSETGPTPFAATTALVALHLPADDLSSTTT